MPVYKTISGWGNFPRAKSALHNFRLENNSSLSYSDDYLIPRGLGRSYGDQAINLNQGVLLTQNLNRFLAFDSDDGLLTCETGVTIAEIIRTFSPRGWFPMIAPGTKYVTVGGAIANDIHGKGHHVDGSFVNSVTEFTILLANGSVVRASRDENIDLFWSSFGGLGLLGLILTATIQLRRIETTFFNHQSVRVNNLDHLLDSLDELDDEYNYSVAWLDSLAKGNKLGKGVLTLGNHAKSSDLSKSFPYDLLKIAALPKFTVPFELPTATLNRFSVRILNTFLELSQSRSKSIVHYEEFFFPLDKVNHWNRGYGKKGFIQYQFVIPLKDGRKNIRSILQQIVNSNQTPFLNVLKKFGKGEKNSFLSFPMKGYTFAIDFPVRKGLISLTKKLDKQVIDYGGRVYLGKDALLDPTSFRQMYPKFHDWLEVKRKYDPTNQFSSNLSRRLEMDTRYNDS